MCLIAKACCECDLAQRYLALRHEVHGTIDPYAHDVFVRRAAYAFAKRLGEVRAT